MEIIDTHAQLWTAEAIMSMPESMRERYIRIFGDNLPTLTDTISDMDAAGVSRSVVVAVDAETRWDYKVPNELVAQTVREHPDRLAGFVSVDPNKGDAAVEELRRAVKDDDMKGPVKEKALFGSDYPLVSRQRIISELAQIDIPDEVREYLYYRNALEVIPGLE